MRRLWMVVLVGAVVVTLVQPVRSMQKLNTLPGAPGMQLGKKQPGPALSAAQQATIKRRIMTAMSGLEKVHVVGTKTAPIPPEALDALAEWRGQNARDVEMWWDPDTRTPFFIKGNDLALPTTAPLGKLGHDLRTATAVGTFSRLPEFLGLRNAATELRQVSQQTDHLGMTHVRFQQTYRGHDVWARDLYCHFTSDSRMNLINGRWTQTPVRLDGVNPAISSTSAIAAVKSHFADRTQIETSDTTLVVYIDSDQTPHWAWMVRTSLSPTEGYDVFIDAITGGYLHQVSFVYSDGPVVGSGVDLFGQTRTVYAYLKNSTYYMINTTKPMFNAPASTIPNSVVGGIVIGNIFGDTGAAYYETSTNQFVWDSAAVSCQRNLGLVYDYYMSVHSRNSIDSSGGTLTGVVNDGRRPGNAVWNDQSRTMTFGTAVPGARNMARALDVTGHEMSHGVIDATAGLVYEFQSGALNESFADIFGTMVEFFTEGNNGDWLNGEDAKAPGSAYRSMADPPLYGQPDRMSNYDWTKSIYDDNGGVHKNSGIPNKAFYLIAIAIGRDKADSIYYQTLRHHLNALSQFIDCRLAVLQAASDLYPGNAPIQAAISSAFNTVEIYDGPPTPIPGSEPVPTSAQYIVAKDLLTGRLIRFDTSGTSWAYVSSGIAVTKPSVPDSGNIVFFVDAANAVRAVSADGSGEAVISNPALDFANIAVSPDGRKLAYDILWDATVYILNLDADSTRIYPLYTPAFGTVLYNVLSASALQWSIDGENIIYDCLSANPVFPGVLPDYWDIMTLSTETGVIRRTVSALPQGVNIGNPTLAITSPFILAFDAELATGNWYVLGANLVTNHLDTITYNGMAPGAPSYAPDDRRVIYHNTIWDPGYAMYRTHLWRVSVDSTLINGLGNDQLFALDASFPNWRFTGRDTPVDVSDTEDGPPMPSAFSLYQNYPNPFNASTVISYDARSVGTVALEIFNILGQRVFVRNEESVLPGRHTFTWDGADQSGESVPSGLYLYRVTAGGVQQTRKMVLLK